MVINKKGFLLAEETLKIIISVIAITFLIYFLASLYNTNKDSQDLALAQASLEHLIEEVGAKSSEVEIYNPKGWNIISWPYDGERPRSCDNLGWNKCLCICKEISMGFKMRALLPGVSIPEKYAEICDDAGYCLEKDIKVQPFINIKEVPTKLNINYGDEITITRG